MMGRRRLLCSDIWDECISDADAGSDVLCIYITVRGQLVKHPE